MASRAQAGRGTVVSIGGAVGSGTEGNLVAIGEVTSSPVKAPKWNFEDTTSYDSGSDMEYLTTMRGDGTCTLTVNRVGTDAGQQAVVAAAASGALYPFALVLPKNPLTNPAQAVKGDTIAFNAYVLSTGDIDMGPTKKVSLSIDLKISGPITTTAGN